MQSQEQKKRTVERLAAERNGRSDAEQIKRLNERPGQSRKERARLKQRIKAAQEKAAA